MLSRGLADVEVVLISLILREENRGEALKKVIVLQRLYDNAFMLEILRSLEQALVGGNIFLYDDFFDIGDENRSRVRECLKILENESYNYGEVLKLVHSFHAKLEIQKILSGTFEGVNVFQENSLESVEGLLKKALSKISCVKNLYSKDFDFVSVETLIDKYAEREIEVLQNIKIGDRLLDKHVGCFYAGEITILYGLSGVGKSIYSLYLANCLACAGNVVLYCNLEMSPEKMQLRLLSQAVFGKKEDLPEGKDIYEITKVLKDADRVPKHLENIHLLSSFQGFSLSDLESKLLAFRENRTGIPVVVFIDLLSMLRGWGTQAFEIENSVNILHEIVKKTNVHMICVLQANRKGESKSKTEIRDFSKKLYLDDVKNSHAPVERSRLVLSITRLSEGINASVVRELEKDRVRDVKNYKYIFKVTANKFSHGEVFSCRYLVNLNSSTLVPIFEDEGKVL